ncbi:Amidinotransferase [Ancylostoma duodenale]|uniref:Amidinotransferase n=1 Tax=Ancylostoma duodenale TaxID=51022 RepID=A0A0C2HDW9_9BILA|nr:Amidinotransferase [Ancylostoma duodenale]
MSRAAGQLLKRVLMVPPQHFTVEYTINPWMGGVVDKAKAFEQWNSLKSIIEKEGVQVLTMEQTQGLPDQVFVCNSGLVHNNNVYLSRFRHKERTGEQEHYLKWFKSQGFHIFGDDYPEFFEGGGDAVFSDPHTLWAGFGPRSAKGVYERIKAMGDFEIVICELTHPNFYHLDTRPDHGLVVPTSICGTHKEGGSVAIPLVELARVSMHSLQITRRMPDAIAISDAEANAFVCNAITVRNTVISPIGVSAATREALRKRGMSVVEVDMSEFMKSGGACQCLVLRL